jgi:hypothetical protein
MHRLKGGFSRRQHPGMSRPVVSSTAIFLVQVDAVMLGQGVVLALLRIRRLE